MPEFVDLWEVNRLALSSKPWERLPELARAVETLMRMQVDVGRPPMCHVHDRPN